MITIQLDPRFPLWYGVCYRFETGVRAREVWVALQEAAPADGAWHTGVYRHQRIGKDKEPVLVSIVGDKKDGFEAAEAFLAKQGGEEIDLHPETWIALVKRRVEKIVELTNEGAGFGRHVIPHPPEGDEI